MPELPEVEVLVRHLARLLPGRRIRGVDVRRARSVRPSAPEAFAAALCGATIRGVRRRAKYLLFDLEPAAGAGPEASRLLLGHLGMTGRIYLGRHEDPLPRHVVVLLDLGAHRLIFEDSRYFGRMTLDPSVLSGLGPEPLEEDFLVSRFGQQLGASRQAVKVKLLDQTLVAGLGNIYASEALHRAGISPQRPADRLKSVEVERLHHAIREVLGEAIGFGSTVPLGFDGGGMGDGLFYFGRAASTVTEVEERLRVYDRDGGACVSCGGPIRRVVQSGRSTYFCPRCQR